MNDCISVIIPCYNAEKYIEKSLNSIINQTYSNLEIILVNDGSTDDTKKIISSFLSDKRIKYIEQKNGGEFAARNTGLFAATGKYIGFVDADDYIAPEMYEKLYNSILNTNSEMAVCNFNLIYEKEESKTKNSYSNMPNGVYEPQKNVYGYWCQSCASPIPNNYVWTRLYIRDLIIHSGIHFENHKHSIDTLFNFKLLPHMKKVVFVNEGLYNYIQHSNSGIHTIANKTNIATLYADTFQSLVDYYRDNNFHAFYSILPIHAYTRLKSIFFIQD